MKVKIPASDAEREVMYKETLRLRLKGDPLSNGQAKLLSKVILRSMWKDHPFRAARAHTYAFVQMYWPVLVVLAASTFFFDFDIRPKVNLDEGDGRAGRLIRMMPFTVESD